MKVIGLTGGIGTGKSTVAAFLAERGIPVIDADLVARQVVQPGSPVLRAIAEAFGAQALSLDGALDRAWLRQHILADASARDTLNGLTHPPIIAGIAERLGEVANGGARAAVVEAALMIETGSYRRYDALIVVTCEAATQLARVIARDDQAAHSAQAIIDAQLPLQQKEALADVVIHNDEGLDELLQRTLGAWHQLTGERI